ncbi:MAG: tRNA dimethylallyltransferase [Planctomycetota bacterium]
MALPKAVAGTHSQPREKFNPTAYTTTMSFPEHLLPHCCFLAGPTAAGKSAVALLLAQHINAEILALDSMTVYRGMDIGTAKASTDDQRQVPHHLLDLINPDQEFSIAEYLEQAAASATAVLQRGRTPLFVGGSGLYLKALLRGFSQGPAANWEIRRRWDELARQHGPQWIHQQLDAIDPVTAQRLHPQDLRRIIRALEVHELTGRPISADQSHTVREPHLRPQLAVWLDPERTALRNRIAQRTQIMIDQGWLTETRILLEHWPQLSRTASQALGYRELIQHLQHQLPLDEAIQQIQTSTCQFAKRQTTWFRSLEECRPIPAVGTETPEELLRRVLNLLP